MGVCALRLLSKVRDSKASVQPRGRWCKGKGMEKGLCGALTGGCMHPIAPQQTRLCQYDPLPTNDDGGNNNNNNQQQQQQDDTPAQEDQQQDDTPIATGDGSSSSSSDTGSDGSSIEDLFDVCKRRSSYPSPSPPMFSRHLAPPYFPD